MLATSARIATPFYILYVTQKLHAHTAQEMGSLLAMTSLALLGADTLSNIPWGYLGDKTGFRLPLLISLLLWVAATVLVMNVDSKMGVFIAFCGFGLVMILADLWFDGFLGTESHGRRGLDDLLLRDVAIPRIGRVGIRRILGFGVQGDQGRQ